MKLLLDEMYPPALTEQLVLRAYGVTAVKGDASLEGLADDEPVTVADADGRAVVTENVRDFVPIARAHAEAAPRTAGSSSSPATLSPRDRATARPSPPSSAPSSPARRPARGEAEQERRGMDDVADQLS